nr:futalosine hydrolase [Micromonospora sp. DSM 115978]
VLGGEREPDAELMAASTVPGGICAEAHGYLAEGGPANLGELHRFLADTLLLSGTGFAPPAPTPTWGVLDRPSSSPAPAATEQHIRPTVGVLYYRAHHVAGNTAFVEALCQAVERAGGQALPVFCASLRAAEPDLLAVLGRADALVVTVLAAGVGGPAAAAGTATALAVASAAGEPFGLVVSMGTAGGFRGCADIGDLLIADRMLAADLGAEAGVELPDAELARDRDPAFGRTSRLRGLDASLGFGSPRTATGSDPGAEFLSLDELGLGSGTVRPDPRLVARLATVLDVTGRRVVTGTVVTVATVTGTEQRAAVLTRRHDPVGEAMEGYAVGVAATAYRVPSAEIRAVSNAVGRRDRSTWDIPAALASLRTA